MDHLTHKIISLRVRSYFTSTNESKFQEACLYYFREQTKKFVGIKFNKHTQEISPKDSYYAMDYTPTISIGHIVKIFSCLQISLDVRISMIMWNTCYLCRYIRLYELLFGLLNSCFYCTSSCISNSTSIQGKRMFVPFLQNFLPCRLLLCNSCVRFPKLHILQPSGLYVCKNLYSYGHLIQRTLHSSEL